MIVAWLRYHPDSTAHEIAAGLGLASNVVVSRRMKPLIEEGRVAVTGVKRAPSGREAQTYAAGAPRQVKFEFLTRKETA